MDLWANFIVFLLLVDDGKGALQSAIWHCVIIKKASCTKVIVQLAFCFMLEV